MFCHPPPLPFSFLHSLPVPPQDRCHRIGQTREVHIYRLVSTNTIEENILRKSDQKRQLDWLAIQSGGFNTDFLAKLTPGEWVGGWRSGVALPAGSVLSEAQAIKSSTSGCSWVCMCGRGGAIVVPTKQARH